MRPVESNMTEEQLEDHRLEIENRLRNLFWTVSGDYAAEFQPDAETYACDIILDYLRDVETVSN